MSARFPLETVLRVRRLQVRQARGDLALRNAAVRSTRDLLGQRLAAVEADNAQQTDGRRSGMSGSAFAADAQRRLWLGAQVIETRLQLAVDEHEAAVALECWQGARSRERGLETLEERHRETVRAAEDRAGQRIADDLAGAAFEQRRRLS
ncbi:MAG: flagellar export protein FliJ [Actinomycetales bacterium]